MPGIAQLLGSASGKLTGGVSETFNINVPYDIPAGDKLFVWDIMVDNEPGFLVSLSVADTAGNSYAAGGRGAVESTVETPAGTIITGTVSGLMPGGYQAVFICAVYHITGVSGTATALMSTSHTGEGSYSQVLDSPPDEHYFYLSAFTAEFLYRSPGTTPSLSVSETDGLWTSASNLTHSDTVGFTSDVTYLLDCAFYRNRLGDGTPHTLNWLETDNGATPHPNESTEVFRGRVWRWDTTDDGRQPCNLRSYLGWYYRVWVGSDGNVQIGRARWSQPPFDFTGPVTTSGSTSRPVLYEDQRGRLFCLYALALGGGAYSVLETYSDSDGQFWSSTATMFSSGRYPFPTVDPTTGAVIVGAYVSGTIQTRLRYPGDLAFRDAVTVSVGGAALAVADDTFGLAWMGDVQGRIVLVARPLGETEPREYRSFDEVGGRFELVT